MDDANLGGCYPPWPPSLVDNILLDLHNSSHRTQPHSIIVKKKNIQSMIFAHIIRIMVSAGCYEELDRGI